MTKKFLAFAILTSAAFLTSLQVSTASEWNFFKSKRDHLLIVGSSTISPLMAAVSEEFARNQNLKKSPVKTPIVESTGTRNGFRIFCGGVGYEFPDFVNASRPINQNEIEDCASQNVRGIVEIKIGYDGIIIGNAIGGKKISLTMEQIFLALAQKVVDHKSGKLIENPYKKWSQISPALPDREIMIYGPPLTSGTRDVFVDIVTENFCFMKKEFIDAFPDDHLRRQQCRTFRSDGKFLESGENDNLIIQNLKKDPNAFGIFGFDFLIANKDAIQAVKIDNVEPNFSSISSKKYKLSRPLFVYFKKENLKLMPQMRGFIEEIISADTIGRKGYLLNSGLIALSDSELDQIRKDIFSQL